MIVVVYVDDIMFGSNREELAKGFADEMKIEFEMSMIGELSFYLGLQIQQKNTGTFISQEKYLKEMLKKFKMEDYKPVSNPMITRCKLCADDGSTDIDKKTLQIHDRKSVVSDSIKTIHHASSRTSG